MKSHILKQSISAIMLMIISIITISIAVSSCNKEEMDNKDETVINDNYYVKYIIHCNYPKLFSNWSVTTPEGTYTKNGYQTRHWEQTYVPVKKGFKCAVQISGEPDIEIHISKNQEPFALKTIKTGTSASYTINF